MKIERGDVSNQRSVNTSRDVYEHEVFLSFNDDDMAIAFNEWWRKGGFKSFQKFYKKWEGF